jgi:uncharacterized protein YxeA
MKKNQKGIGVIVIILILAVVLSIVGAGFYVFKHKTRVSITNDGATFSFDMGVPADSRTNSDSQGSSQYYEVKLSDYSDKVVATAYTPKQTKVDRDFSDSECKYTSFKVTILDKLHTVCDQKDLIFVANFDSGNKWYQVSVFSQSTKTQLSQDTAKRLLESLKVEQTINQD